MKVRGIRGKYRRRIKVTVLRAHDKATLCTYAIMVKNFEMF